MEGIHKMELQHFSHQHALFLREADIDPRPHCKICYSWIYGSSHYVCDKCGYYVHEECAELPHHITHPFHSSHPLTLITNEPPPDYICDSCHRDFYYTHWYRCDQCDFYMDKKCALMDPITCEDNQEHIQHFSHQHPMPLVYIDGEDENTCFACRSTCSGPTYACKPCYYFLHKSCAELPREVQHPLHPRHHTLSLRVTHKDFYCKLCDKKGGRTFAFKCQQCSLWLCVECGTSTTTRRTIQFKGQEHLNLYFVERLPTELGQCSAYSGYCKQQALSNSEELRRTCSSVLRCLECDYTVHLLCGPLPNIIKYEYHIHLLNLGDSIIEVDDSDEFYCDICETERDPRICVYYCGDCKFIAHIHCVASEIIKVLKGELGDHVELKTVREDRWESAGEIDVAGEAQSSSAMTLKDVFNKLNDREIGWLKRRYKWDDAITSSEDDDSHNNTTHVELGDEDIARILKLSRFTYQDFNQFLSDLEEFSSKRKLEWKASDMALKVVKVEGYMIPQTLAPVLKTLRRHYGDVSPKWGYYTKEWKSIMYFLLCKVVKSMSTTKVLDITLNLLREWFHHLIFVKHKSGFRINFACAHLERLIPAFLGAQANRIEDEIPTRLEQRMAQLQQEIAKTNAELEICKEYRGASPKSAFMKKCLKKASDMKWKDACEDLFSYSEEDPISHMWGFY